MSLRLVSILALLGCAVVAADMSVVSKDVKVLQDREGAQSEFPDKSGFRDSTKCGVTVADQSIDFGEAQVFGRVLLKKIVFKAPNFSTVNTEYLNWRQKNADINYIKVVDMIKRGTNADVTVECGGLGRDFVSLKFKSQPGEKIQYNVWIYGW